MHSLISYEPRLPLALGPLLFPRRAKCEAAGRRTSCASAGQSWSGWRMASSDPAVLKPEVGQGWARRGRAPVVPTKRHLVQHSSWVGTVMSYLGQYRSRCFSRRLLSRGLFRSWWEGLRFGVAQCSPERRGQALKGIALRINFLALPNTPDLIASPSEWMLILWCRSLHEFNVLNCTIKFWGEIFQDPCKLGMFCQWKSFDELE